MFGLGLFEIIFIAVLGLLLIGPEQLPEVTKALARFITDIRRSTNALKSDFEAHSGAKLLKIEEERNRNEIISAPLQTESTSISEISNSQPQSQTVQKNSEQLSFQEIETPGESLKVEKTESES